MGKPINYGASLKLFAFDFGTNISNSDTILSKIDTITNIETNADTAYTVDYKITIGKI